MRNNNIKKRNRRGPKCSKIFKKQGKYGEGKIVSVLK
jgi:hypothetical protein